jgi:hypothetical protein
MGTLKKVDMSKCSANGVKGDGMFGKQVKATRESRTRSREDKG